MNQVLSVLSLPPHSLETYKTFVGEGADNLVRRSVRAAQGHDWRTPDDRQLPRSLAELSGLYRAHYEKLDDAGSTVYPGVTALLTELTARKLPMAVLSNKHHVLTQRLVSRLFGGIRFTQVFGERAGIPRKPDPTVALQLADIMGIAPGRFGFVGDTPIDIHTARNAGMVPIGVVWGFRSRHELQSAGASVVLEHPEALLDILS